MRIMLKTIYVVYTTYIITMLVKPDHDQQYTYVCTYLYGRNNNHDMYNYIYITAVSAVSI